MKIKDIKYGLIPTGPGIGTSALQIFFENTDTEYQPDSKDLGEKWEQNPVNKIITENSRELFNEFYELIKSSHFVKQYDAATNASHKCFLVFMGGVIDDPKNYKEFERFSVDMSNRAWNNQISQGLSFDRLKPPYSIFVGKPTFMSGKNQFYQTFNSVYPVLHLTEDGLDFNSLSFQEALNGPFTTATFFVDDGDIEKIHEVVKKFKIPNHKVILIDKKSSRAKPLEGVASDSFYRYYPYLTGTRFLEFI